MLWELHRTSLVSSYSATKKPFCQDWCFWVGIWKMTTGIFKEELLLECNFLCRSSWALQLAPGLRRSCQPALRSKRCCREWETHWPAERYTKTVQQNNIYGGFTDINLFFFFVPGLITFLFLSLHLVFNGSVRADATEHYCPTGLQTG